MRASSLQELVYKGGQAGVTKATVTITFDNSDKKQSPLGYETFDEITVSRQVSKTYCSLLEFFLFSVFLQVMEILTQYGHLAKLEHLGRCIRIGNSTIFSDIWRK